MPNSFNGFSNINSLSNSNNNNNNPRVLKHNNSTSNMSAHKASAPSSLVAPPMTSSSPLSNNDEETELDPQWFVGEISRTDAENILARVSQDNYSNGKYPNTLLVRTSSIPVRRVTQDEKMKVGEERDGRREGRVGRESERDGETERGEGRGQ